VTQPHWIVRVWPNVGLSFCALAVVALLWVGGFRALEPAAIGGTVGIVDGLLTYLGRRDILPRVRTAMTPGAAMLVHMHSPWTRGRNTIAILVLVVMGAIFLPRLSEPLYVSAVKLLTGYGAVSYLLRALVLSQQGRYPYPPSNNSLQRP